MENKTLGILLIIVCVALSAVIYSFNQKINSQADAGCTCTEMTEGGFCPHQKQISWQTYLGIFLISAMAALSIYLIFFEKSQKAIVSTLEKQRQIQTEDEKFEILLKGLTESEQKVLKAVKEQDGITQQTLRLRTGLHKSKLSILLDGLEKKGIVARLEKGKTKQVFLRIKI